MRAFRLKDDAASGLYFRPRRRSATATEMRVPAVADVLDVSRPAVNQLIQGGHLRANRDGEGQPWVIKAEDLDTFVRELVPVELVEWHGAAPAAANIATPSAPAGAKSGPTIRATGVAIDEGDGDEDSAELLPCPNCRTVLVFSPGILAAECPECGQRLEIEWPEEEEDAHAESAPASPTVPETPHYENPTGRRLSFGAVRRRVLGAKR